MKGKDKLDLCQPRHVSGYQWPGSYSWNCIYTYRLHSTVWIGIAKQLTTVTLILEVPISLKILLTVLSYLSYGTSKESVCKYQVGRVSFFFWIVNKLMIDFGLCWHFKVRSVH